MRWSILLVRRLDGRADDGRRELRPLLARGTAHGRFE
jgi:hypothetical protein